MLAVKRKIKTLRRTVEPNQPLDDLLRRVNSTLQGWAGYFRAGVSSATFSYLSHYTWQTVWRWLRRKHRKSTWETAAPLLLRRRLVASHRGPCVDRSGEDRHHPLPLPRCGHPLALASHR